MKKAMQKAKRSVSLGIVLLLLLALPTSTFAAENEEVLETNAARAQLTAAAEILLQCENGEFPDDISITETCDELMKFDPELAERVYEHVESVAYPIESVLENLPEPIDTFSAEEEPRRNGTYMRDGDGGYFVYEEFDEEEVMEEPEEPEGVVPYTDVGYSFIAVPKNDRRASTVCKILARKNGMVVQGSGFFIGNTVVATAAHVLYIPPQDNISSHGWIDEGYIIQAYAPTNAAEKEPYGRKTIDNKNMGVGASWAGNYQPDDDWGVAVLKSGKMGGNYSYLPKKQIDVNNFIGEYLSSYGYEGGDPATWLTADEIVCKQITAVGYAVQNTPMRRINGRSIVKPDRIKDPTYRVLFSAAADGGSATNFAGMSGGPVLDINGNVVAINTGISDKTYPFVSIAVSLDKWLYPKLKAYE